MPNKLVFEGLDALRAELRNLPAALAAEASGIVMESAESAKTAIVAAYPSRTGNLKKGVKVRKVSAGQYGAGAEVASTAQHAYLYEVGSMTRKTSLGTANPMPAGNVAIPAIIRQRRKMYAEMKDLLVRHGLVVSGEP